MKRPPRWLAGVLARIRRLAADRRVRLTYKARRELAEIDLGLDLLDACDVLESLRARDWSGRALSEETAEWMYMFKPSVAGVVVYVKLVLRGDCVVISFHEDDDGKKDDDQDGWAPAPPSPPG